MTGAPSIDAAQVISTLAGLAIACWGFWRINQSPAVGDWVLKLAVLAMFACATLWVFDRITGNTWRWDHPAMMVAIAVYLWCGIWRHYRANRRRAARTSGWTWSSEGRRQ